MNSDSENESVVLASRKKKRKPLVGLHQQLTTFCNNAQTLKMFRSTNSVQKKNPFSFVRSHQSSSFVFFSLNRCDTWRSSRRAAIRPCRGCATSPRMEVGYEFTNTAAEAPYVQLLGNSWAMRCNVVGTSLEAMPFSKKGIRGRTWGNVATSREMWESELLLSTFPELHTEISNIAHAGPFC